MAEENPNENINSENTNTKNENNVTIQENVDDNKIDEQLQDATKKILNNEFYSSFAFARKCALISSVVSQPSVSPERRPFASSFINFRVACVFS